MLQISNLNFQIKNRTILKDLTFKISSGEFVAIIGPNGAGKSTLLSALSKEILSVENQVQFKSKPLNKWNAKELAVLKAKFSQHQASEIGLSCYEVVLMGRYPYFKNTALDEDHQAIVKWMKATETISFASRTYEHLSGGEKQRLHLARVFSQLENDLPEKLYLLDEPLNNLDVAHQFKILDLLKQQAKKQHAIVVVLHDINLAAQFADKILLLQNGNLIAYDKPENVLTQELISKTYNFPCVVTKNPINNQPLLVFG